MSEFDKTVQGYVAKCVALTKPPGSGREFTITKDFIRACIQKIAELEAGPEFHIETILDEFRNFRCVIYKPKPANKEEHA